MIIEGDLYYCRDHFEHALLIKTKNSNQEIVCKHLEPEVLLATYLTADLNTENY